MQAYLGYSLQGSELVRHYNDEVGSLKIGECIKNDKARYYGAAQGSILYDLGKTGLLV